MSIDDPAGADKPVWRRTRFFVNEGKIMNQDRLGEIATLIAIATCIILGAAMAFAIAYATFRA